MVREGERERKWINELIRTSWNNRHSYCYCESLLIPSISLPFPLLIDHNINIDFPRYFPLEIIYSSSSSFVFFFFFFPPVPSWLSPIPTHVENKPNPHPKYPTSSKVSGSPPQAPSAQHVPRTPKNINVMIKAKMMMCFNAISAMVNVWVVVS